MNTTRQNPNPDMAILYHQQRRFHFTQRVQDTKSNLTYIFAFRESRNGMNVYSPATLHCHSSALQPGGNGGEVLSPIIPLLLTSSHLLSVHANLYHQILKKILGLRDYYRTFASFFNLSIKSSTDSTLIPASLTGGSSTLWKLGLIKHQEKGHLSHDIQTLTQHSHTNAWYCDTYPQIGAYISSRWSINDMLHFLPVDSQARSDVHSIVGDWHSGNLLLLGLHDVRKGGISGLVQSQIRGEDSCEKRL